MNLIHLTNIAIKAAQAAGSVIQQHMHDDIIVEHKQGGASRAAQVVTKVDRACEAVILTHLMPTCDDLDIALLSEETEDDGSRFHKEYFWCIDPMDGTLPFINKYPGYSVSIALVRGDGTPVIGVVLDPSTDTLYHAINGHGVYKNHEPWATTSQNDYLTYVTDKRLQDTPRASDIQDILDKMMAHQNLQEVQEIAGAGSVLNAIIVLENGPACMIKFPKKETGGGSIWDYAATTCMYHELGFTATNFDGGKLDLNRKDGTFMNHEGVFYSNVEPK